MKNLKVTTKPDSDQKSLPGSVNNYSPHITFYDVRSSDSSKTATIPEQRRKIRHPTPNNDVLSSLGSYTRTKPIPKKDKLVEELKRQHEHEIKSLRAEMERIRVDQRRLQTKVSSVWTQSTMKKGNDYRSEEKAARRAIPPEIFYDLPPRKNQLNSEPLTLSDLRTIYSADTTGRKEPRCHSNSVTGNPSHHVITPSTAPMSQLSCLTPPSRMNRSSRLGN